MNRLTKIISLFLAVLFVLCSCVSGGNTSDVSDTGNGNEESFNPDNASRTLISKGKSYTCDPAPTDKYPDMYGQQLTDGLTTTDTYVHYTDSRMVGFTSNNGYDKNVEIVIDLGDDGKRITALAVRCLEFYSDGVRLATTVRFSGSDDGEDWNGLGTGAFKVTADRSVVTASVELKEPVDYRYIKMRVNFAGGSHFFFLDEVQVFADVEPVSGADTVELAYKNESVDKHAWKELSTSVKADHSVGVNVAASKLYKIENAVIDDRTPVSSDENLLTDTMPTSRMFSDSGVWVGFSGKDGNKPSITVDLEQTFDNVFGFRVHALGGGVFLGYPDYVDVYGSADGKNFTFIGRVYAPADGDNFAYTLLLDEYVEVKSVKFEFGGDNTFWVEEIEVMAGYGDDYLAEIYPPLSFPTVTEDLYWDSAESDYKTYQNLLLGLEHQVSASFYVDSTKYPDERVLAGVTTTCLTDGQRAPSNGGIDTKYWFYTPHTGTEINIFYDLGNLSTVDNIVFSFLEQKDWAINRPSQCDIYLSDDGSNWYKVATRLETDDDATTGAARMEYNFELDTAYAARFIRFRIEVNGFCLIDELEVFGTKAVDNKSVRLADSGIKSVPFYTNLEDAQYATTENTPIKAEDINLVYISQSDKDSYNENRLLPYVAYLDEDGNIVDTFMDGFLYLPTSPLPSGAAPHLLTIQSDWEWLFEETFHGVYGFDELDKIVGQVKDTLGAGYEDYKVQVYATILTMLDTNDNFGDIDGDGETEVLTTEEGRDKVARWYIGMCLDEFESCGYENLEFGGFYWMNEEVIWADDDEHIITQVADIVHEMGSYFLWIPYYTANRYYIGYDMGFDLVNMQPNVVFDLDSPLWRFPSTAELTKLRHMCVEIEHTREAMSNIAYARNYMLYLYYGAVYGYMDAIHLYYNDLDNISQMGLSDDPLCRLQYDATYQFAKGTLDITPDTKDTFKAATGADTILHSTLNPENDYQLYTLTSMPENGTVSLSADGTFAYYPDKGFTGTDTFTYTYNNLLGESEECTVEITVS